MDEKHNFTHDGSPEYARKSLQRSLKSMGIDYVDLYILCSKDPKVPIEESVKAMAVSTTPQYGPTYPPNQPHIPPNQPHIPPRPALDVYLYLFPCDAVIMLLLCCTMSIQLITYAVCTQQMSTRMCCRYYKTATLPL